MNRLTRTPVAVRVVAAVRERPALLLVIVVGLIGVLVAFAGVPTAAGPRLAETGAVVSIGLIVVAVGLVLAGGILGFIAYRRRRGTRAP